MQQEQAPTITPQPPATQSISDELREFARQHRELARRNYDAFVRAYGRPSDRLKEFQSGVLNSWRRVRAEAREGYTKLDRDVAAKAAAEPTPVVVKSTNGATSH